MLPNIRRELEREAVAFVQRKLIAAGDELERLVWVRGAHVKALTSAAVRAVDALAGLANLRLGGASERLARRFHVCDHEHPSPPCGDPRGCYRLDADLL